MYDMTRSYVFHDCFMTHLNMRADAFICVKWLTFISACPCRVLLCVTWLVHMWALTHLSFICVPWLLHDAFIHASRCIHVCDMCHIHKCLPMLHTPVCDIIRSYVYPDSLIRVTRFVGVTWLTFITACQCRIRLIHLCMCPRNSCTWMGEGERERENGREETFK